MCRFREVGGMLEDEYSMLLNSFEISHNQPLASQKTFPVFDNYTESLSNYETELRHYLDRLESEAKTEAKLKEEGDSMQPPQDDKVHSETDKAMHSVEAATERWEMARFDLLRKV